jgi:cytochrome d ubiquinol oxidase subunit II
VGFKYRSKRPSAAWRSGWDWALFAGGFVPTLVFGVAVGNVLQGLPFRLDSDLRTSYEGSFLGLFTPFTLLCGLLSVAMIVLHGAAYLSVKVEHGPVHHRARRFATIAGIVAPILFAAGGAYTAFGGLGYRLTSAVDAGGPSNPLRSTTVHQAGAWLGNYGLHPWMMTAPALGFAGAALALFGLRRRWEAATLAGSATSATGIIATVGLSMFPFILPSAIDAHSSLSVWNASSSRATLLLMLICTVVLLPIVLLYTAWVYRILRGRITLAGFATNPDLY